MQLANRVLTAVLATAILSTAASAAPLSPKLTKALDGLPAGGKLRVLVRLKDAGTVVFGAAQSVSDSAGRSARLKALRENAKKSQASLLETVKPFGVTNGLESSTVRALWLANAVAMDADRETIEKLAARGDVKEVVLNETIPAPKVTPSAVVNVPGDFTWGLTRIHIPEVRALYKLSGAGVRVGHLDTGIAASHPDLKGKVLAFKDFSQKHKEEAYDDEGHGSHTAGTIAGGNSSGKHIGVAPEAKIICAKIFGSAGASLEGILGAMEWVVDPDGNPSTDDGAQIVSNSWGSDASESRTFWDAVKKWVDLGVFPCFAGGNNGPNTVGTPGGYPHSFAVGAVDPGDGCSEFSSRGPVSWDGKEYIKPDVAAPGSSVLSAWHTGNGFTAIQGTSMACPHVSGVIALMLQANPKLTIDRIRQVLESTADDRGDAGKDNLFGSGIVNTWKAIAQVVPSGEITGTLKNDAGQAVKGEVTLPDFGITVATDDQGKFSLLVPGGDYKVSAKSFGFRIASFDAKVTAGEASTHDVALTKADDGKVAGTVVNKDGKALKATVSFPGTGLAATETNADTGAFEAIVPQGEYTMVVKSFGYEPRVIQSLQVGAQAEGQRIVLENLPDLLLVDDDGHDLLETYFSDSLQRIGRKFTNWDSRIAGAPTADVLIQYPMVIWHTGFDYQTTFTPAERDAVKQYLASGGHLFLSSQLGGVNLRQSPYFAEVFHAKFVTILRRSQGPIPAIVGSESTPLATGVRLVVNDDGGQNNQDYPSILLPADAKASLFLKYEGENRGGAGLRFEDGAAKMVYTAFGLEGVGNKETRDDFFKRVLAYLAPTPADALRRIDAVDALRVFALAAKSPEAARYFEYEEYFVAKASKALAGTPQGEELLSRFAASSKAGSALREVRRAAQGRKLTN
ncbi:MAG: S8 family serine peptidase [Candidatus Wallbacteria bacterium]|nr:S8 family serine peptidase [Candidatus Wallbacteria bacterium]